MDRRRGTEDAGAPKGKLAVQLAALQVPRSWMHLKIHSTAGLQCTGDGGRATGDGGLWPWQCTDLTGAGILRRQGEREGTLSAERKRNFLKIQGSKKSKAVTQKLLKIEI